MSILDLDCLVKNTDPSSCVSADNHPLFPQFKPEQPFRWIITGMSGCGKTTLIVSALLSGQIKFEHIYLYTPSVAQGKYKLLCKFINSLEKQMGQELMTVATSIDEIVDLEDIPADRVNICIFDDLVTEKDQKIIEEYFIRGRHRNVCSVYLTQSYFDVPKVVRKQANYFSVFKTSSITEFNSLASAHSLNRDLKLFKKMFQNATRKKNDFLFLDLFTDEYLLQVRRNYNGIWSDQSEEFVDVETTNLAE